MSENTEENSQTIKFHNTLTGTKEVFEPVEEGVVRMYNCGPTVYNYAHLGNLRSFVFADLLKRLLAYNGYEVKQVVNITDVGHLTGDNLGDADTGEDRMEKGAKREGKTAQDIAKYFTDAFFEDIKALNTRIEDTSFPRASEYIEEQQNLIEELEQKGFTYTTSDGVYFNTSLFPEYGKLGEQDTDNIMEGARVEKNPEKNNPTDFALWKFSSPEENRQQEWDSPWGVGYPGWHIECSAMGMNILGEQLDIHTGGVDHIPIHHNNEIAQSECATGKPFSRFWLHHDHILINGSKISKSTGNTLYLYNLTDEGVSPLTYRYWLLTAHYRTQMNFTWEAIEGAQAALMRLYGYLKEWSDVEAKAGENSDAYVEKFTRHINDDLDTPKAVALMWSMIKDDALASAEKKKALLEFDKVFGLDLANAEKHLREWSQEAQKVNIEELPGDVQEMVDKREKARKEKDWETADSIRDELSLRGYDVEDTQDGPVLRKN